MVYVACHVLLSHLEKPLHPDFSVWSNPTEAKGRLGGLQEYMCRKQNAHNEPASQWLAFGSRYLASASGSSLQEVTPKTWQLNSHLKSHSLPPVFLLAACHAVQAVVTPDPSGMSAIFSWTVASCQIGKEGRKGIDIDWRWHHARCYMWALYFILVTILWE